MAYVDDGGAMGTTQEEVNETHEAVTGAARGSGLKLHEGKSHLAQDLWERVGVVVDGSSGLIRPKAKGALEA